MLDSSVLHESPSGTGDVKGIAWKPGRGTSASLITTCAHQVVVYKAGESRRTHQWSFRPSALTEFSHAAVFLPSSSRYVGVRRGSTLVTWLENDQDVRKPLSAQAPGQIQAVHVCPHLGDVVVVVLVSGVILLYRGGLENLAECGGSTTSATSPNDGAGASTTEVVWSGVRGKRVLVLDKRGSTTHISVFAVTVEAKRERGSRAPPTVITGTVALLSSHILPKPVVKVAGTRGADEPSASIAEDDIQACDAAILAGSDGVISVAWRSPRGPLWTKVVVSTSGAREEFARPAGIARLTAPSPVGALEGGHGDVAKACLCNGHKPAKQSPTKKGKSKQAAIASQENRLVEYSLDGDATGGGSASSLPAVAAADGGRLLVHSGGARPRLATWDATYGVMLDDGDAPERSVGSGSGPPVSRVEKSAKMAVSGDGATVALVVEGRVLVSPLPVEETGTLAFLLRRKRPATMVVGAASAGDDTLGAPRIGGRAGFPSVDLGCNASAARVLLKSAGNFTAGEWEAAVVEPFRDTESAVIRSLEDAARRKDSEGFERVLREHMQHHVAEAATSAAVSGKGKGEARTGDKGNSTEAFPPKGPSLQKKGLRARPRGRDFSAAVVSAAVELCLANREASLWKALGFLVKSGGVSARHHRGLVDAVVQDGPQELLEAVMLYVPDLPEADAVKILRHSLSEAARLAKRAEDSPPALTANADGDGDGDDDCPPLKRSKTPKKRRRDHADDVHLSQKRVVVSDVNGGVGDGEESIKSKIQQKRKLMGLSPSAVEVVTTNKKQAIHDEGHESKVIVVNSAADKTHHRGSNGTLANGHSHAHDDAGGTSSESGDGVSEQGTDEALKVRGNGSGKGMIGEATGNNERKDCAGAEKSETLRWPAAARAERGVRVALTLPHNEAFLRSALSGLSHGEVIIVIKILTRLLSEGHRQETASIFRQNKNNVQPEDAVAMKGLPSTSIDAVLGWASAALDSHFTRLALGGSVDGSIVDALQALKRAATAEAECCDLLYQVRSLVNELGRRHKAIKAERRRPKHALYSIRELRF